MESKNPKLFRRELKLKLTKSFNEEYGPGHDAGTQVYYYRGPDYGLVRDSERHLGLPCSAVTLKPDGSNPFFVVPSKNISIEDDLPIDLMKTTESVDSSDNLQKVCRDLLEYLKVNQEIIFNKDLLIMRLGSNIILPGNSFEEASFNQVRSLLLSMKLILDKTNK